MSGARPQDVTLFTYRVGFGDCFLLRFGYGPAGNRHVLVDFGSTAAPQRLEPQLEDIAADIASRCAGKLEAIVATHRHADHLGGFQGLPWRRLQALSPRLVLLPWTEDPRAAADARSTPRPGPGRLGASSRAHARSLASMQELASSVLEELGRKGGPAASLEADEGAEGEETYVGRPFGKSVTKQLAFLGRENLRNARALENLYRLDCEFLSFGRRTRLEQLLPGVKVHVLGPPTLEQTERIARQRAHDPAEFWHLASLAARRSATGSALAFPRRPRVTRGSVPPEVRWFMQRLDAVRGEELLQVTRLLDAALNNTSLILLFEVLGKKLLFPGDAQVESWSYALAQPKVRSLLRGVDVYKVGHHGSLNATPKSLWDLFEKKGPARGLKTFLSTRPGKHGSPQRGTEVPRGKLVEALVKESALFSTTELTRRDEWVRETKLAP